MLQPKLSLVITDGDTSVDPQYLPATARAPKARMSALSPPVSTADGVGSGDLWSEMEEPSTECPPEFAVRSRGGCERPRPVRNLPLVRSIGDHAGKPSVQPVDSQAIVKELPPRRLTLFSVTTGQNDCRMER